MAEATQRLRLRHVVITAVARDDLADGGADHFRRTIEAVRALSPQTVIEVLTPDFNARDAAIDAVLAAHPHIFNHNLETVRRLTPAVRSRATYDRSLSVLSQVKARRGGTVYTKSGLMLGLGETEEELFTALADLRQAGCDLLTLGQYLQPTLRHLPVVEFVTPEKFAEYGARAREMGFRPRGQRADGPQLLPRGRVYTCPLQWCSNCGLRMNRRTAHTTTAISSDHGDQRHDGLQPPRVLKDPLSALLFRLHEQGELLVQRHDRLYVVP